MANIDNSRSPYDPRESAYETGLELARRLNGNYTDDDEPEVILEGELVELEPEREGFRLRQIRLTNLLRRVVHFDGRHQTVTEEQIQSEERFFG